MNFWPYKKTKQYLLKKGIKNFDDWNKFKEFKSFPKDSIPLNPEQHYKEWTSWENFFGLYPTFGEFKKYIRSNNIKNSVEYFQHLGKNLRKNENQKFILPAKPQYVYKNKWKGWEETSGYYITLKFIIFKGRHSNTPRLVLDYKKNPRIILSGKNLYENRFKELRKYARYIDVKNQRQWILHFSSIINHDPHDEDSYYIKENALEDYYLYGKAIDFPQPDFYLPELYKLGLSNPARTFKGYGWKGWNDFLGTTNLERNKKTWSSFELARKYARMQKLKNRTEWEKHFRTNKGNFFLESKKLLIPQRPDRVVFYQDKWNNWKDFLGDNKKK